MKENNIAIFQASSTMSAGSAQSTLRLIFNLKELGLNPYVFLNQKGDVETVLKENGIKYYIINEYSNDTWTELLYRKNSIQFWLKKCKQSSKNL